ncbi:hypothetical protein [Longimicrobium sp.]|uniref:hypothetical protein n=1 Tax=Longimicrobium sp. TaxID=2029185 RepID=UPI002E31AD09|nr:hypothetical protein [Longimicrobium sp.]HEX6040600.1 hypothetical protein [Longimicrobium sp.]
MRTPRPILLASAAAVVLLAAACSGDAASPAGPTTAGSSSVHPFFTAAADTTGTDSIIGGYGSGPCLPLDFDYEPHTGTDYVVCPDTTTDSEPGLLPTAPGPSRLTAPTPGTTTGGSTTGESSTGGSTTTTDSVQAGYGNGSTGGIEYDRFEYDPETGTETVATPDTTPKPKSGS